ncbi:ROK family transcriptional regulator [Enterococcus lactis]|uniref:ROK family transcriptional regulator n=3 Tax=Enterococcus TaxID=1350 RepID=A0AAJ1WD73_9ENTE|nr:ROK family transcriptional regulator [Enterococcus lactis]MDP8590714.1 ROK family transcriptional regulator [Enterococcus lactis]
MISSKYTIRELNQATLLKTIIEKKEVFRAELAAATGLNKASVSDITKKLLDDQLIVETRVGDASTAGGRKPIMLTFNPQSATALSFDIGYNYLEGMLSYIDGTVLSSISKRRISIDATNVFDHIQESIHQLIRDLPETPHGIVGMTIGIHGVVFEDHPIFTPYYDLHKIDLQKELADHYDFPIYLHNEANLAALGEYTFSSHYQNLVSISIHSGIGCGIVASGKLQVGKHGKAGELGHSILYPDGRPCPCGNSGCLEQYASNKAVYEEFARLKGLDYVNSDILTDYVKKGDTDATALLKKNAALLSIGINNIIMMYDPDVIVINSKLYEKNPQMIEQIHANLTSQFTKDILVRNTRLKGNAILYGALAVTAQHFLNIRKLKLGKEK